MKRGNHLCNVRNCGSGRCVHSWSELACPKCGYELIYNIETGRLSCSHDAGVHSCGYINPHKVTQARVYLQINHFNQEQWYELQCYETGEELCAGTELECKAELKRLLKEEARL